MSENVLEVSDLSVEFEVRAGIARVLEGVSLSVNEGETLGIVGESGCGKSMTALSIMGLVPSPPGRITGGSIKLMGEELLTAGEKRMQSIRGNSISMIFQEPMTSLNPVFTVGNQIAEAVMLHQGLSKKDAMDRATEMVKAVGIPNPAHRVKEYPHQLSGGMRQRIMIAMALACNPKLLIADEPTTALDVTVQAQIFDLLQELQEQTGTAIVMITHDMGAIAQMADRVMVMYAGRVIEQGPVEKILSHPSHPYTRGLITCVPHLSETPMIDPQPLPEIPGVVPPLDQLGQGCAFAPRCHMAADQCGKQPSSVLVEDEHLAACWFAGEGDAA